MPIPGKPWWRMNASQTGEKILGYDPKVVGLSLFGRAKRLFVRERTANNDRAHLRAKARGEVRRFVMELRAKKVPEKDIDRLVREEFGKRQGNRYLEYIDPKRD